MDASFIGNIQGQPEYINIEYRAIFLTLWKRFVPCFFGLIRVVLVTSSLCSEFKMLQSVKREGSFLPRTIELKSGHFTHKK